MKMNCNCLVSIAFESAEGITCAFASRYTATFVVKLQTATGFCFLGSSDHEEVAGKFNRYALVKTGCCPSNHFLFVAYGYNFKVGVVDSIVGRNDSLKFAGDDALDAFFVGYRCVFDSYLVAGFNFHACNRNNIAIISVHPSGERSVGQNKTTSAVSNDIVRGTVSRYDCFDTFYRGRVTFCCCSGFQRLFEADSRYGLSSGKQDGIRCGNFLSVYGDFCRKFDCGILGNFGVSTGCYVEHCGKISRPGDFVFAYALRQRYGTCFVTAKGCAVDFCHSGVKFCLGGCLCGKRSEVQTCADEREVSKGICCASGVLENGVHFADEAMNIRLICLCSICSGTNFGYGSIFNSPFCAHTPNNTVRVPSGIYFGVTGVHVFGLIVVEVDVVRRISSADGKRRFRSTYQLDKFVVTSL